MSLETKALTLRELRRKIQIDPEYLREKWVRLEDAQELESRLERIRTLLNSCPLKEYAAPTWKMLNDEHFAMKDWLKQLRKEVDAP